MTTNWQVTASFSTDLVPTPVWLRILYFCTSHSKFCYFTSPTSFIFFCVMNRWTSASQGPSLHLQIFLMLLVFKATIDVSATFQHWGLTSSLMAVFWSRKVSQALIPTPQCLFCAACRSVLPQCHPTAFWEIGEIFLYQGKKKAPPQYTYWLLTWKYGYTSVIYCGFFLAWALSKAQFTLQGVRGFNHTCSALSYQHLYSVAREFGVCYCSITRLKLQSPR